MIDISLSRKMIDEIDAEIRQLFEKRMEIVKQVSEYKLSQDKPVYDASREQAVIDQNVSQIQDESIKKYYQEVLVTMMNVSKEFQKELILRSSL